MPPTFRHFALNADDVQRAKRFYEAVFEWEFTPYGPPNFYQILNAGDGFIGALQERRELAEVTFPLHLVRVDRDNSTVLSHLFFK